MHACNETLQLIGAQLHIASGLTNFLHQRIISVYVPLFTLL